jgi:salicylate hydroxylase
MPAPQLHVAIVGAGLGGLATAIGIAKSGHSATILEKASALDEVCITSFSMNHVLIT